MKGKFYKKTKWSKNCESCQFYDYDEFAEVYVCRANLDQDEMAAFILGQNRSCSYYRLNDEYGTVRQQN